MSTNNSLNFGTGSSGQILTSNGAGVSPTFQSSSSTGPMLVPPWVNINAGFYWSPFLFSATGHAGQSTSQTILLPFATAGAFTLTAFAIYCDSYVSNDTVRFGLYSCTSSTGAAALVTDFGTVTVSGTGFFGVSSLTQAVSAGFYYLALNFNSSNSEYLNIPAGNGLLSCVYSGPTTSVSAWIYNNGAGTFPATISAATLTASGVLLNTPVIPFMRATG